MLDLLSQAYDQMEHDQRHWVFGKWANSLPPTPVDGESLLAEIEQFQKESLADGAQKEQLEAELQRQKIRTSRK